MKVWKVKITGDYKNSKNEIIDFDEIEGVIPYCDIDVAHQNLRKRYPWIWIPKMPGYTDRLDKLRSIHINDMEEGSANLSFVGKDIKEMSWEELQDLATAKDLKEIPLYKKGSLLEARRIAYIAYANQILEMELKKDGFNLSKAPIIKADAENHRDTTERFTIDEILEQEQEDDKPGLTNVPRDLNFEELKQLAKSKGIKFHPSVNYDTLYARVYK